MICRKPTPRFHGSGFTLVEILIGLALMSFILLMLFGSLHIAAKSWTAVQQKTTRTEELRMASDFIRHYLSQAVPLLWVNPDGSHLAFKGDTNAMHFAAPLPAHRGGGGLYLITLKVIEENGKSHLIMQYQGAYPDHHDFNPPDGAPLETAILIDDVRSVTFSYFGKRQADAAPGWVEEWAVADQLPQQIQVKLSLAAPEEEWPEIAITLPTPFLQGQPQFLHYAGHDQATP